MKTFLDGSLLRWTGHLGTVQHLMKSGVISTDLSFLEADIIYLVRQARKKGDNWVWSYDGIRRVVEDDRVTFELPSVSICEHFGLDTHNKLQAYFKKQGYDFGKLDTEASAWYPSFEHREDAERCIDGVNEMLDKRYGIDEAIIRDLRH
jgi:hypothetical protein